MEKANKNIRKSAFILFTFLLFLPLSLEAAMTRSEINQQLSAVSFVLVGLNRELQTGKSDLFLIKAEIDKVSKVLTPLLKEASLAFIPRSSYSGEVLGAFYPSTQSTFGDIGFAVVEPQNNGARRVFSEKEADILYFKVNAYNAPIKITQADISFDNRVWRWAEEISLISGGKVIAKQSAEEVNFSLNNGQYTMHLGGFSLNVDEDRSKIIRVRVKIRKFIPNELNIRVYLNNFAIRISGHPSVNSRLPEQGGGPEGDYSRQLEIKRNPNLE